MPDLQEVLKLLPEDLLNGGLLSTASLKDILLPNNLLPTNQITQVGANTLTVGNQLPLGTSNLGNTLPVLGGGMHMKTTPAPSKKQTTTGRPPLGLNVNLPGVLG